MSRWLSNADVYRLTGKRRFKAQIRVLDEKRIPWTAGKGGEPLVAADAPVDGKPAKARNTGPRWHLINA